MYLELPSHRVNKNIAPQFGVTSFLHWKFNLYLFAYLYQQRCKLWLKLLFACWPNQMLIRSQALKKQDVQRTTVPSAIRDKKKYEHYLSVAVSYCGPLHGKLHHATKFQAITWFPQVHLSGPSLSWKSSVEHAKIGRAWPFYVAMCFMVLCKIPQTFRPIAAILKEFILKDGPLDLVQTYTGNFKGPWNVQKLAEHSHFKTRSASCYCASSHQISGWYPWRVRGGTSSLWPIQKSLLWLISKFRGTRKNWPSMAILYGVLLHGTLHNPTKF